MFHGAETLTEVIYQAVGAGSVCWESMNGTETFQDQLARRIAEHALERIAEIQGVEQSGKDHAQ